MSSNAFVRFIKIKILPYLRMSRVVAITFCRQSKSDQNLPKQTNTKKARNQPKWSVVQKWQGKYVNKQLNPSKIRVLIGSLLSIIVTLGHLINNILYQRDFCHPSNHNFVDYIIWRRRSGLAYRRRVIGSLSGDLVSGDQHYDREGASSDRG